MFAQQTVGGKTLLEMTLHNERAFAKYDVWYNESVLYRARARMAAELEAAESHIQVGLQEGDAAWCDELFNTALLKMHGVEQPYLVAGLPLPPAAPAAHGVEQPYFVAGLPPPPAPAASTCGDGPPSCKASKQLSIFASLLQNMNKAVLLQTDQTAAARSMCRTEQECGKTG